MKKIAFIMALLLVFTTVLPLVSCSSKAPELDSIKERLVFLIEESKELNVVFFGNGLPVFRREDALSDKKLIYFNDDLPGYDRVMENTDFLSIDEIKAAAEEVYSSDYISEIYESAFDGVMTGEASAYVRFYDNGEWLHQNINIGNFTLNERIYDYSTMGIVDPSNGEYINISVESYSVVNQVRQTVYLSFIYENGEWYLDSPTY